MSLAEEVARELENQIVAGKWAIGFQIGQEADLASKLGVSRWTLREALRMLEVSGLVQSRRGAGGGLFVASNAHDFVCKMASNYFECVHVSAEEFADIYEILGREVAIGAIDNLSNARRLAIQEQLKKAARIPFGKRMELQGEVLETLTRESNNPALILFIGTLERMVFDAGVYSGMEDAEWHDTLKVATGLLLSLCEAIVRQDQQQAVTANNKIAMLYRRMFESSLLYRQRPIPAAVIQRSYDVFPPSRPLKKADRIERALREDILQAGGEVGLNLGSDKELGERFGVGRWVLREALRSLEQLGVIEVERGGHGGLRVVSPDPGMIAEACRRHLRREGLRRQDAAEVRTMLDEHAKAATGPTPINDLFQRVLAR